MPSAPPRVASRDPTSVERARGLLRERLVWDNHGCMPVGRPLDTSFLPQLQRYRDAGVDAVMLNIGFGEMGIEEHLRTLAAMRHWLLQRPREYRLIDSAGDVEAARAAGQLAVGFDIEGANAIGDQLSLVQMYRDLGVRWMLVAYNRNNRAGGGCQDDDGGLTAFGRELLTEMERVGLQVCCSHTGHRTVHEILETATRPVIFSHSNASAVHAHPRNIPDELIRACADGGGVVGITGIGSFLGSGGDLAADFARHVDHVVQLVGPRHVSIGLDYVFDTAELREYLRTMRATFPAELGYDGALSMLAPEDLPQLVVELLGLGYDDDALALLLGGNLLRLAQAVWPGAAHPLAR